MREGAPSTTAQRVAAYRLAFERLPTPFGDPGADERLAHDVVGPSPPERRERMDRYLRARTAFFDRVVVDAVEHSVTQIVLVGAGYDGRALRYAKPGVRWFEVDHPSTQHDKRARLERLGIETPQITFVPVELQEPGLADGLVENGFDTDTAALLVCEGVTAYLDQRAIASMLREARSLAVAGTLFALSFSPMAADGGAARRRFGERVAAVGEPIKSSLTSAEVAPLLNAIGWRVTEPSKSRHQLGFVVAEPA
jgi:methyltransferase (TIGR00027 family)